MEPSAQVTKSARGPRLKGPLIVTVLPEIVAIPRPVVTSRGRLLYVIWIREFARIILPGGGATLTIEDNIAVRTKTLKKFLTALLPYTRGSHSPLGFCDPRGIPWDNRFEVYQGQLQRLSLQRKP